jgi:hypothetical protein
MLTLIFWYVYHVRVAIFFSGDACAVKAAVEQCMNSARDSDFPSGLSHGRCFAGNMASSVGKSLGRIS